MPILRDAVPEMRITGLEDTPQHAIAGLQAIF
jgi:hypothetical protein